MKKKYKLYIVIVLILLFCLSMLFLKQPSNERNWEEDQTILPEVTIENNIVTFKNVRDFIYSSETEYQKQYIDVSYPLDDLETVEYIVVPFGSIGGAHTFLSFGFGQDRYIAISVEIRKEKNETFSAIKGLFRKYEIMYVVATEEDVIKLRTNHRENDVYLYPTKGTQETYKNLLQDIAQRINALKKEPEFYNTITNNCTTNIAKHMNNINDKTHHIPWNVNLVLPEGSDEYALKRNFLDVDEKTEIEDLRERYFISDKAKATSTLSFSSKIRQ